MDKTSSQMFDQCYHVFQPICDLTAKKTVGFESLIRSKDGTPPNLLFQQVIKSKRLADLDMWSIDRATGVFFSHREMELSQERLFVNIFPSTVMDDRFPEFVRELARKYEPYRQRIVFEIIESLSDIAVWHNPLYAGRLLELRKYGFLIALDDFGEGTASFKKVVELAPDFIKLDMFFGKELYRDKNKQKLVRLFVEYCRDEAELILEGIEHEEDLDSAISLGVRNGQGYLLGKPSADILSGGHLTSAHSDKK